MRQSFLPFLLALALCIGVASAAEPITPPEAIRAAAVVAVGGDPATTEASVDSNLRMAVCSAPLQAVPTSARIVRVRGRAPPCSVIQGIGRPA